MDPLILIIGGIVIFMRSRLLVTGFGSFRDIDLNPSGWIADQLVHSDLGDIEISATHTLEVSYGAVDEFVSGLDEASFDLWLMLGVHGRAERMHLETLAKNFCGGGEDVRGVVAGPAAIDSRYPPQIAGSLFNHAMESPIASITSDAGGFLCNYLFFRGVTSFPEKRVGFLHVPRVEMMKLDDQLAETIRIISMFD